MAIKLKSVLKIQRQPLLLAVRAVVFAASLWLLADQDFSTFQLCAFIIIGAILYFVPVFQTLLVFPSFLTLMIVSPIAMSVFGPQVGYPSLLAAFFGFLFFMLLGIKQVVFLSRIRLHHALHLGLFYFLGILFFAAPGGEWYLIRSLGFYFIAYLMLREFFLVRSVSRGPRLSLMCALTSFVLLEAMWVIGLLPLGFINAAGVLLVLLFTIEEVTLLSISRVLHKRTLISELLTFAVLLIVIFGFSTWTLP